MTAIINITYTKHSLAHENNVTGVSFILLIHYIRANTTKLLVVEEHNGL